MKLVTLLPDPNNPKISENSPKKSMFGKDKKVKESKGIDPHTLHCTTQHHSA
jgi:hypothetical protein